MRNLKILEEDLHRTRNNKIDFILHKDKLKPNQDALCHKIFWSGVGDSKEGDWCCVLAPCKYDDLLPERRGENTSYFPCQCEDYNKCDLYLLNLLNNS